MEPLIFLIFLFTRIKSKILFKVNKFNFNITQINNKLLLLYVKQVLCIVIFIQFYFLFSGSANCSLYIIIQCILLCMLKMKRRFPRIMVFVEASATREWHSRSSHLSHSLSYHIFSLKVPLFRITTWPFPSLLFSRIKNKEKKHPFSLSLSFAFLASFLDARVISHFSIPCSFYLCGILWPTSFFLSSKSLFLFCFLSPR